MLNREELIKAVILKIGKAHFWKTIPEDWLRLMPITVSNIRNNFADVLVEQGGTFRYRDFDISINDAWPYGKNRYTYVHKDYDGDRDSRYGFAGSVAACKAEIDEWYEEETATT